ARGRSRVGPRSDDLRPRARREKESIRDISDDEQQSYRRKSSLPCGLRRRRANGFVAAPSRYPASAASLLLALARRRAQRGARDFCHGLLAVPSLLYGAG